MIRVNLRRDDMELKGLDWQFKVERADEKH
jgi:hypothetical protein